MDGAVITKIYQPEYIFNRAPHNTKPKNRSDISLKNHEKLVKTASNKFFYP